MVGDDADLNSYGSKSASDSALRSVAHYMLGWLMFSDFEL